jgi:hypothetical protein
MAHKTRAGGCTAPPIKTTSVPASPRQNSGPMPNAGKANSAHIDSQTRYGLHEREADESLPPAAVKAGWKQ